jgi:hypothetical protein
MEIDIKEVYFEKFINCLNKLKDIKNALNINYVVKLNFGKTRR